MQEGWKQLQVGMIGYPLQNEARWSLAAGMMATPEDAQTQE